MKLAVAAAAVVLVAAPNLAAAPGSRSSSPVPADVYLGVACHDTVAKCGRVGVAVWLPRAADHVSARLLGTDVTLTSRRGGSGRYGYRVYWTGFAHVVATQIHPGSLFRVRIAVTLHGASRIDVRSVPLSGGWG
jgi:hypothetical protein